jgi:hypothetical protein
LPIHIFPARLTDDGFKALAAAHQNAPALLAFWNNLKQGHDLFEKNHRLPRIQTRADGTYDFSSASLPSVHADSVVRELYQQVVARKPLGIPKSADKETIWPFLSKGLKQRLDAAQACEDDYFRQHTDKDSKPGFDWLEASLFSGANERGIPATAVLERTEREKDGSSRVYVRLTYKESFETYGRPPDPANTFHWHVAAATISEGGRFVVDDVLLFEDDSMKIASRLADSFPGCEGSRWVGDKTPSVPASLRRP